MAIAFTRPAGYLTKKVEFAHFLPTPVLQAISVQ